MAIPRWKWGTPEPEPDPTITERPGPAPWRPSTPTDTDYIGKDEEEETREELGIPPSDTPGVITQPRRVPHRYYTTHVSDVESLRGITPETTTPMLGPGQKAEIRTGRLVTSFEKEYQPYAQDYTQQKYEELMADKARQLNMQGEYNPETGTVVYYYTSNEQLATWQNYQGVAATIAVSEGQKYYSDLWTQKDIEKKAIDIYKEEYANQALMLVANPDGTYDVVRRSDYERTQEYKRFQKMYESTTYKTPVEHISHRIQLIGAYIADPHKMFESMYHSVVGDVKASMESESLALFGLHTRGKKEGFWGTQKAMLGPGSLPFTLGTAYLAGMGFGTAIGGIAQLSPMVAKGVKIGAGGYFLGRSAKEIETIITTGRTIEWGGLLGLAPVGLSQQAQVMSEAERFSSIAMFGTTAAFGIAGYAKGLKLGRQFMAGIYKPKYVEVRTVFPKLEKTAESDYGIAFKGMIKYQSTRIRTLFGKELPWSKEVYSADLAVKGILGKKPVSFIDPKTGRTAVWRPGEALYTLEKGMLYKQIFGITLSKKYPGGGIYKAYPSRPIKVDVSKKMGVAIEPYIKQTKLATIFTEKPGMSLMLTQSQLASELFKPIVESKFYPSEAKNIIKGNIIETKAITQMWKLPDSKKLMELISVKKSPIVEKTKETYKLTPFRQVSKTETPISLIIGKTFGISALLKTREPIIEKPYKTPITSMSKLYTKKIDSIKPVSPISSIPSIYKEIRPDEPIKLEGKPSRYKTAKSSLIIEEEVSLVYPPDVDIASLFGTKTLPIYATGIVSVTKQDDLTKWNKVQTQLFEKFFKQKDATRLKEMQLQRLGLGEFPASLLSERPKLEQRQAQTYLQVQAQMQKLLTQQVTTPVTVTPPVVTPITIIPLAPPQLTKEEIKKLAPNMFALQAYNVYVKPTQWRDGKRISYEGPNIPLSKFGLNEDDARSLGAHHIDNNPKATFVVKPVEGKVHKLRKKTPHWSTTVFERYLNSKGFSVELSEHRIDSPGELEGITMKGIAANKRKARKSRISNKTFSGVDKDFGKVNKMVEKTMKRFMKKAGVF